MPEIVLSHVTKRWDKFYAVDDLNLVIDDNAFVTLLGPSGCGKTTLLRCLNFLTVPDEGQIAVNGETLFDAADPNTQKESEIRRKRLHFGLVFQNFNLFPQYTARQNVMLASELLAKEQPDYKARKKEINAAIEAEGREYLAAMGLTERAGHYPHQLSGGMCQRVRLYEMEQRLDSNFFVRISNSDIINLRKVKGFDLSFAGTICVTLSNGTVTYVSRRFVAKIKQLLGI